LRILGVDPGSLTTGWGLLTGSVAQPRLESSGVVRLAGLPGLPERLARLRRELDAIVRRERPESAAVEAPFHGRSARDALQLAHARGVVLAVLAEAGLAVAEYAPATVKRTITGSGRADKLQVRHMAERLLGADFAGQPQDLSDAVAVAWCHLAHAAHRAVLRRSSAAKPGPGGLERRP
jgi:crossover junction endodeoxyribonuclease RuvC